MLLSRFRIYLPQQEFLLPQKLSPIFQTRGIQNSCANRRQHRASRLPFMTAIDEPALGRQRIDV